jgi:ubiquinone biosynthesis protein UbiJ
MVEEIGCEDLLQKPVTRPALRRLLARIMKVESAIPDIALSIPLLNIEWCHLLYAEDSLTSQVNPIP